MARRAPERPELLAAAREIVGEARRGRRRDHPCGGRQLTVLEQRLDDRQLEEREVGHHRGERPAPELVPHAVPVGVGGILPVAEQIARAGREQGVALDAHVHL